MSGFGQWSQTHRSEINQGVRLLEVCQRIRLIIAEAQQHLYQTCHTGSFIQVSNVGLDRAEVNFFFIQPSGTQIVK